MARGINKVIWIGNLGQDPETRYLPSGQAVTTFSLASSERWTDKTTGEIKERTEWLRVEAWGKLAEICSQYLTKGSQVYVEGKLQTDKWDDAQGVTRYSTKVRLDQVQFLGGDRKEGGSRPPQPPQQQSQQAPANKGFDDDIPF